MGSKKRCKNGLHVLASTQRRPQRTPAFTSKKNTRIRTSAVTLPAGSVRSRPENTSTSGLEGYAKCTFRSSTRPSKSRGEMTSTPVLLADFPPLGVITCRSHHPSTQEDFFFPCSIVRMCEVSESKSRNRREHLATLCDQVGFKSTNS